MLTEGESGLPEELSAAAAVIDAISAAVVIVTSAGVIAFVNEAVGELTGFDREELLGREVEVLVPPEGSATHRTHRTRYAEQPSRRPMGSGVDIFCVRADGHAFPADVSLSPLLLPSGAYVVATIRDETERRSAEAELSYKALHDPLTGLANRTLLFDRLERALARAERSGCPAGVFYIDLDGFKEVNDRHGHVNGDLVLAEMARRLKQVVRPGDTVARIGGDEFVAVCEGLDEITTNELADRFVTAAREPVATELTLKLTASVGVVREIGISAGDVVEHADRAMYRAKRAGGDRASQ